MLVINPGTLSRESSLGTYCTMTIMKPSEKSKGDEKITSRIRADIIKL